METAVAHGLQDSNTDSKGLGDETQKNREARAARPGPRTALGLGEPEALPGPRLTAEQMPPGGCWELVMPTSSPSWPLCFLEIRCLVWWSEDQREDVSAGCVVT